MAVHHHHTPDGTVVFHDHAEDFHHRVRVDLLNSEGWRVTGTDTDRIVPECSEMRWPMRCGYRRHDDA